jgi:short-subunit dehydrogenase
MSLNQPLRDWRGKRVWLIGASSGIGEALALALAARGACIAISGRHASSLDNVARQCGGAEVLTLDISDPVSVTQAWQTLSERWGGCDVVIMLAGTYVPTGVADLNPARVDATLATNLGGIMSGVAAIAPALLRQGYGHIAMVSSVAGYSGLPRACLYGATKAGLINFAESLYLELHPRGVNVHLINPGFVRTRLTAVNDFKMPALIEPDAAARAIIAGFARGDFEIHFPRRFTRVLKLLRLLPYRLYFPLVRRLTGS